MRLRKKLFTLFIAAIAISTVSITAFAQKVPDLSRRGSIHITMHQGANVISGGSFTLCRVGRIQEKNGDYSYVLTDDFADCGESLNNILSVEPAERIAAYAEEKQLTGSTREIGEDGTVTFSNLEPGLYLLVQKEEAPGYNKVEPFLVSIPVTENGVYIYDVDASPKVEIEKETESESETEPESEGESEPESEDESEPDTPGPGNPGGPGLPQTGQLNWPVPVLVILGLLLFSLGWILRFGNKKGNYEE